MNDTRAIEARRRQIRILVADDQPGIRDSLAELINEEPTLLLVGLAQDAEEAVELANAERPDVVVLDVSMPKGGGPKAAREISRRHPGTRLLALSAHEDDASVHAMLGEGAQGYVVKGAPVEEILEAIYRSARGEGTLSTEITTGVVVALGERLKRDRAETRRWEQWRTRIQRTIDEGNLIVLFQPIVHLRTGRVTGFEAVSRFPLEPDRPTQTWFAEAAAVGLVHELELTTARAALSSLDRVPADAYLSINLSPDTASSPEFRDLLLEVDHERLVVEMTEHASVDDYATLNEVFRELRWRGLRLAIDDVGAGFASLRHVLELSPDFMKLDVTLTRDVDFEPRRRHLAGALTTFAEASGIDVIAEGIETEGELNTLQSLDVAYGQGFFFGPPGPLPT